MLLWLIPLLIIVLLAAAVFSISAYIKTSTAAGILSAEEAAAFDADCILVLGAGVLPSGYPSNMLEDRILRSIELYEMGASDYLLVSGDHGQHHYDEVNVMKQYAVDKGVPSEDIFMDHAGFSTYESMYRAKEIFQAKKVLIVTQEYHLYRSIYIARALGMEAYGVSADMRPYRGEARRQLRELASRSKDFFQVILKPQPTYLGEPIPLQGSGDVTNDGKDYDYSSYSD